MILVGRISHLLTDSCARPHRYTLHFILFVFLNYQKTQALTRDRGRERESERRRKHPPMGCVHITISSPFISPSFQDLGHNELVLGMFIWPMGPRFKLRSVMWDLTPLNHRLQGQPYCIFNL